MKPHDPRSLIAEACWLLDLRLETSQQEALVAYADLIRARAVPLGLVSEGDQARVLSRHVLDSLRGAVIVRSTDRSGYDIGSGAGLPGIPVAIACPWLTVTLAESRRRGAAFLEMAIQELALSNAVARWGRAEDLPPGADLCFARAFAPLPRTWELAAPLLAPGGRLVQFAGRSIAALPELPGSSGGELRVLELLDSGGPLAIITR